MPPAGPDCWPKKDSNKQCDILTNIIDLACDGHVDCSDMLASITGQKSYEAAKFCLLSAGQFLPESSQVLALNVPDITIAPPEDDHLWHVIDTTALYVLDGGCAFEQAIMERGRGNSLFSFLFELGSKEHTYYVWRLYSFAQLSQIPSYMGGGGKSGIAEAPAPPNNILFIQNLLHQTSSMMLQMLFGQHQGFKEVRMVEAKPGIAFIEYRDEMQATVAMHGVQGFKINPDSPMSITYAKKY